MTLRSQLPNDTLRTSSPHSVRSDSLQYCICIQDNADPNLCYNHQNKSNEISSKQRLYKFTLYSASVAQCVLTFNYKITQNGII